MSTLAEFRSALQSMGNFAPDDTRITSAVIDREVNRALKRIALVHDWPWLQGERDILTTSDQAGYALPEDFLRLISLRNPNLADNLYLRSIQELDEYVGTGLPRAFAVWGGKVVLAYTPNGEYTFRLRYIKQENLLTNDTDVPLIPTYWEDGVHEAALVSLYRMAMREDDAGLAESRFQIWKAEGQDNVRQTRGTPRILVRPGSAV